MDVRYASSLSAIVKNTPKNSAIAFVGAGNIDEMAKKFIKSY